MQNFLFSPLKSSTITDRKVSTFHLPSIRSIWDTTQFFGDASKMLSTH